MFHSRPAYNKINRLHERALRIVYDDDVSAFDQLNVMDKSFCIPHQNIQKLLTEIIKTLHDIPGNSLKELFVRRESKINLPSKPELVIPVNSVLKIRDQRGDYYIIESREDYSILLFVTNIKSWKPISCPRTICKSFIGRVGYIKVTEY